VKVVPVIDISNGVTVHAVRGNRTDYKPLKSVICDSADPVEVAKAFRKIGFTEIYVADLNAIVGNHDNFRALERIAVETGLQLMVDAGVNDIKTAKKLIQHGASMVIVGTETLKSVGFVEEAIRMLGSQRIIVSLDMKNGQLLSKIDPRKFSDPIDVLQMFQRFGLTQAILLDLARVGSGEGVVLDFLKRTIEGVDLDVFVGGGVRDINDLMKLKELGVSGVLLATALHSGKINVEELKCAELNLS
jgi:phosphoribosylformimino-5-aminoimidazole carboxamide ribotide isomerase